MGHPAVHKITVALAGNPNVGKSTLFNALTGLRQHTGNWAGKTVGIAKGRLRQGDTEYCIVDLPGTYALDGKTEDEKIAAAYIGSGEADCTVVVCDGSCLERNLILALQILSRTERAVVCVNLMDEAKSRGIRVDGAALSHALGVPVVMTAAGKHRGLTELMETVRRVSLEHEQRMLTFWDDPVSAAQQIAASCVTKGEDAHWRTLLDKLLVSRRYGVPVMLLLLFFIIWLTVWGANYPAMALQWLFDRGYDLLVSLLGSTPWWLRGVIADGLYATSARVIAVMLPPMAIFFPLFTVLEDVGYLPRMAFLLDHGMRCCGGCGKQALTLCMGLGCNAVGVMGCRIIDSPRERLAAILTNAMVPCNGRFPALIVLGSLFFSGGAGALAVAACVALGVAGAMVSSGVLRKTALRAESSTFLMEMPPFRRPRLCQILVRSLLDRTLRVAMRALTVAAPAGVVLWILANTGLLTALSAVLEPLGRALGMNGIILVAFAASIPANELLIPVIIMIMTQAGSLQGLDAGGQILLDGGFTWQMAVCTMAFTVFHWPCATTLMTIHRETGSAAKTAAAFFLPTAVGVMLCAMLNLLLQDLCA